MKYTLITLISLSFLLVGRLEAQHKHNDCLADFDFTEQFLKDNLASYNTYLTPKKETDFTAFVKDIRNALEKNTNPNKCIQYFNKLFTFFDDTHSGIIQYRGRINPDNSDELKTYLSSDHFKNRETIAISEPYFDPNSNDKYEGIYKIKTGEYSVAIIKDQTFLRDYVGVIIDSKSKVWKKGQVCFEAKKKADSKFDVFFYYGSHQIFFIRNDSYENGQFVRGWLRKVEKTTDKVPETDPISRLVEYKVLDKETTYLRIPSFWGNQMQKLDSIYKHLDVEIRSRPNLIIDVRGNPGGSDIYVKPLLRYLHTKPIPQELLIEEYFSSKENIRLLEVQHENMKSQPNLFTKEVLENNLAKIEKIKRAPDNTFVKFSNPELGNMKMENLEFPSQVGVIFDKGCASSCETLVVLAQESDKAVLVGRNSAGAVGYGTVLNIETPKLKFLINYTTMRKDTWAKYEFEGVKPHYKPSDKADWISYTHNLLKAKD